MEAVAIVAALASFLPSLMASAGQSVGEELGSEAGRLAKRLWDRLSGAILGDPIAKDAAERVAARDSDDTRIVLKVQLEDILARDAALRRDIATILAAAPAGGISASHGGSVVTGGQTTGENGMNIGGSVTGNVNQKR